VKIIGFVKLYNEEKNLDRCLSHLKIFCDDIVCCDNSSTDKSLEIAKKYTEHIISLPNEFVKELEHKQKLLEYALTLGFDWMVTLDPDEIFDKPEKIRELCEFGSKNNIDGFNVHLRNLWMSSKAYRVDSSFNSLFKTPIWRNTGNLKFDTSPGLHKPQNPINLRKLWHSDIQIIHYGFATREDAARKYETYKSLGQTGWSLERINPNSTSILREGKNENPKFTIGIPAFIDSNEALEYLKQAIESVNQQTIQIAETLVVDDGSPKEFSEQIKNICEVLDARYVYQENKGIAGARNRCITEARGEHLFFLSADDLLVPDALYHVCCVASVEQDGFYYSDYNILNGTQLMRFNCPKYENYEDFMLMAVESAKQSRMFVCYNIFAKTSLWKENLFDEEYRKNEDLEHFLRCLLVKKIKFIHVPEVLFIYRISPQMWTGRLGMQTIAETNKKTFFKINEMLGRNVL